MVTTHWPCGFSDTNSLSSSVHFNNTFPMVSSCE